MNMTNEQRDRAQNVNDRLAGLSEDDYRGDLPEGFKDRVHTEVGIHLSFGDRVKVLFGWHIKVDTRTLTENVVGIARSRSSIRITIPNWLLRWRMHKNRSVGFYEILPEESIASEK